MLLLAVGGTVSGAINHFDFDFDFDMMQIAFFVLIACMLIRLMIVACDFMW